jgi:hypothetical protein
MHKFKLIAVAFAILSIPLGILTFPYWSAETISITVTDKERAPSNKGGFYMVFSTQETLRNEDVRRYLKFNSSDIQGKLENGKTYKVKVYGWRVPLFSKYRNLVKVYENSK